MLYFTISILSFVEYVTFIHGYSSAVIFCEIFLISSNILKNANIFELSIGNYRFDIGVSESATVFSRIDFFNCFNLYDVQGDHFSLQHQCF